jgi:hypothetical protein
MQNAVSWWKVIGGRQTITLTPALKRTFGVRVGVKF